MTLQSAFALSAAALSAAAWHALVADDDDDTRTLMSSALRRAGFDVRESSNGEELVSCFAALTPARTLVVSDIGMPKCDGIQATIALKKLAPQTLVLLVTAFGDPRTLAAAKDAGADQVLKKPLNFSVLVRTALALIARAPA
jgi:DNA-binding response OmpR family regulator